MQTNPFTEKSQNLFNGSSKVPRNNHIPNFNAAKPITSQRAQNSSMMYVTATDANRANKKPEKENSTQYWAPFAKRSSGYPGKNISQNSGAPNSARGTIEFQPPSANDNYRTRVVLNPGKALTRNPSLKMMSRAGSIDKKLKYEKRAFNNATQGPKQLMKTQSMVISQFGQITKYVTNRSKGANPKDDGKGLHMKSINFGQKSFRDNEKHHQSVCVFATNPNRSVIVEAIGPQRTKIQVQANQKTANDDENDFLEAELATSSDKIVKQTINEDSASTCSNHEAL